MRLLSFGSCEKTRILAKVSFASSYILIHPDSYPQASKKATSG